MSFNRSPAPFHFHFSVSVEYHVDVSSHFFQPFNILYYITSSPSYLPATGKTRTRAPNRILEGTRLDHRGIPLRQAPGGRDVRAAAIARVHRQDAGPHRTRNQVHQERPRGQGVDPPSADRYAFGSHGYPAGWYLGQVDRCLWF